jgi:ADP-dependent NAD(P)H-hydrate dehydratase / NAD(P)H-hydrate epimerase
VRAAVPASVAPFMDLRLPGALVHGLAEEGSRHVEAGAQTIADLAPEAAAVVLGPGLDGTEGAFSRAVVSSTEVPMVIEAGGLSAYPSAEPFSERSGFTVLILDEAGLGRLLGLPPEEVGARRLASARALAERAGAIAVLEGNGCVVAAPGGPVALGPGASGALAANGTGSLLAGLVGTFLARGMDPFAAAAAAVLARSDAGNVAAARVGAGHTVAGDVIQALPEALAPRRDQAPSHVLSRTIRLGSGF